MIDMTEMLDVGLHIRYGAAMRLAIIA